MLRFNRTQRTYAVSRRRGAVLHPRRAGARLLGLVRHVVWSDRQPRLSARSGHLPRGGGVAGRARCAGRDCQRRAHRSWPRSSSSLPAPRPGATAGIIALLVKLVLAGGLGLVVDSRRRALALNAELRREIEARERSEESLRQSERMQRALVESLGEGVGLFDAQDRVVFANQALAGTLGVARDELSTKTFSEFLTEESRRTLAATTPNLRRTPLLRSRPRTEREHAAARYRDALRSERLAG